MKHSYVAKATTTIDVPASKVWEALTKPELIKQYLFGTDVITDWKVGSPITYKGEWEGKAFEDKGKILNFEPEKSLVSTHWSPLSGVPDTPENYHTVTYQLSEQNGQTEVTITQDNNATPEEADHSTQNWNTVLDSMKKLLEDQKAHMM
ncbi:MAG TPA: SRPBCC domain-containing protein [Anaerolineales bacterium]|nr:SRPBCC domain-containing protein [Anaerolineales bacterium]